MSKKSISNRIFITLGFVWLTAAALAVSAAPGDVDLSFNAAAFAHPTDSPRIHAIAVQADGKILVGGIFTSVSGTARNFIARLNADGSFDNSFSSPLQTFGSNSGMVLAIAVQADGRILVGGAFFVNGDFTILARLNADGSLDGGFSVGVSNQSVSTIVIQPDGKIIVGGNFGLINNIACSNIARLNSNGSLETALGNVAGIVSNVDAITLQTDGKILVGGGFIITGSTRQRLTRLNANGTQDTTFNVGDGANSDVFALAVQPDNKILVGGTFSNVAGTSRNALARLNTDGTVDAGFAPMLFSGSLVDSMFVQKDGKIFAVGNFGVVNGMVRVCLVRLNADGTLDSFYPTGTPSGANNRVWTTIRQPDNKYLIGGDFTTVAGISRLRLARLDDLPPHRFADFDGDGRADLSVFRPADRVWYINGSRVGFYGIQWGLPTDKLVPADYDGDGKTDIAIWREAAATQAAYYILNSADSTVRVDIFGQTGDVPLAGDFDGDGKSDVAVYRNGSSSTFYYRASLNNPSSNITFLNWGINGDVPVAGDYDGDNKTDAAIFRPSNNTWFVLRSSNLAVQTIAFGLNTDKLIPADYDGDDKTDIAVFRNGNWFVLRSATGTITVTNWGLASDALVPADYDGDGRTDFSIYRSGVWWILQSGNSAANVRTFGLSNDLPIASVFVR